MEHKIATIESNDELMHFGVKGMKWGVRRSVKKANKYLNKSAKYFAKQEETGGKNSKKDDKYYNKALKYKDKAYTQANNAYELGRQIKFKNAKKAYNQKDKLVDKYVKDAKRNTGVDWNKSKQYSKKFDLANERLQKRTEEYLSTLKKNEVKSLLKKDVEHGYHYVNARIFDPSINYEKDVRVSDEFANRYK